MGISETNHGIVVAATDLSAAATLATEQAARLARDLGAGLCLLHVADTPGEAAGASTRLQEQARQVGEKFGVPTRAETRAGEPAAGIIHFLSECPARLVVVGEHAQGWLREAFIGGTALQVLHRARIPVLLARTPLPPALRHILVAADFSDNALRAVAVAGELFPSAALTILHAYSLSTIDRMRLDGESEERMAAFRKQREQTVEESMVAFRKALDPSPAREIDWRAESGHPVTVILEETQRNPPDILVLGKHRGSALEERLLGSVTQNLLYRAGSSILLVP